MIRCAPPGSRAAAFAPASVGNVAVGFDCLGLALDCAGDRVDIRVLPTPEVRIDAITGAELDLPMDAEANTATRGLLTLLERHDLGIGFGVSIHKGIPLGSGMGGSAASAVAAMVAANSLLTPGLPDADLLDLALSGEQAASGSRHVDNAAPSLLGGLVLTHPTDIRIQVRIPVPSGLKCVLVHPHLEITTRSSRGILRAQYSLPEWVDQSARLAGFVAACYRSDLDALRANFRDVIIETQRSALIPGFAAVQAAALGAGALGCSISGSGPSMFAWAADSDADSVKAAMCDTFASHNTPTDAWISDLAAAGARSLAVDV